MTIIAQIQSAARRALGVRERDDAQEYLPGSWQNLATGLGGAGDRLSYHVPYALTPLTTDTLALLYLADPIAGRVVSARVDDALRQGCEVVYTGDDEGDRALIAPIKERLEELDALARLRQAAKWGLLFGWGGLLVRTGQTELSAPLVTEQVERVEALVVLDRRDVVVRAWLSSGRPEIYDLRYSLAIPGMPVLTGAVHHSHVLVLGGRDTPLRDRVSFFDGFDSSVLQPVWETIRSFSSSWSGAVSALIDASVGVLKLPALASLLARGGRSVLIDRLQAMKASLWMGRWLPIDSTEDIQYVSRSFAGIPELLQEQKSLVAAAAEMPQTRLFGMSPAGLNATGVSDEKAWHSQVESYRTGVLDRPARQIVQLLARELGAADPSAFGVEWPELEVLNALERAQLDVAVGQADAQRVALGMPEEVILRWRYGGGSFTTTPPILGDEELVALGVVASANEPEPEAGSEPGDAP